MLTEKPSAAKKQQKRTAELAKAEVAAYALGEVTATVTLADYLAAPQVYPLISGSRPDLYRAFMCRVWDHTAAFGSAGLLHPDTHFNGDKEAALREAAYRRLRMHGDFVNAGNRFFPPPVGRSSHFGVHIYGTFGEIDFQHLSWLFSVDALRLSSAHDGKGHAPGVKYDGDWDERPHSKRVVQVTTDTLTRWQKLAGEQDVAIAQTRLLTPVSTDEDPAIDALANYPLRLTRLNPRISEGFNETNAKKPIYGPKKDVRLIEYNTATQGRMDYQADAWEDVVLKGSQIGIANPYFKQPSQGGGEVRGLNHLELPSDAVPESEYRRVADKVTYRDAQDRWLDESQLDQLRASTGDVRTVRATLAEKLGCAPTEVPYESVEKALVAQATKPYTEFYRFAWRNQIAPDTERALYVSLLPREAAHLGGLRSAAVGTNKGSALCGGFWASLPLDYFLRAINVSHLHVSRARTLPAPPLDHPLAPALLLRTLRLNCLTTAFADLWKELHDPAWADKEPWARPWPLMCTRLNDTTPTWQRDTPSARSTPAAQPSSRSTPS